ncbi:MAG: histidinol dehydrogenase [Bryobacteraceae bacterium]|nr:histidinol dehydrogenase [Bryobacteraceae bacterium]
MIRILDANQADKILQRRRARLEEAEAEVKPILEAVRKKGDKALVEYARKFDGLERTTVTVPPVELLRASQELSPEFVAAVKVVTDNIKSYARLQLPKPFRKALSPGVRLGQVIRPLDCVAAYIPSGRYPLPSTLLMTVVPAQVAGVRNIVVASPRPNREIYGTAAMLDVAQVFQMGGAHAIAAFAFGTKTVPQADRIVGPGNIYVAAAKKLLAGEVGIDFIAGPTEILIISAEGDPRWIAADMLAQAEHDVDAAAIFLTPSRRLATAVGQEVERQLGDLPTAKVARRAIDKNSAIIVVNSLEQAVELANEFAPEHLSIPETRLLDLVKHAGTVFVGPNSPEAAGDYAAGPSHVLPTNGVARIRGGLSAADFVKVIAVQELNGEALRRLAPAITTLARAEGLEAHARSVEVRLGR